VRRAQTKTKRFDHYKNFKFKVKWDGRYVAGISKVSALKRSTEVVTHREGGDPSSTHKEPGRTDYEAITLERGLTQDNAFEQWANQAMEAGTNSSGPASDFRKDIVIDIFDEKGKRVLSYKVFPLLDFGVSSIARSRCIGEHGSNPANNAGERRLGARRHCGRGRRCAVGQITSGRSVMLRFLSDQELSKSSAICRHRRSPLWLLFRQTSLRARKSQTPNLSTCNYARAYALPEANEARCLSPPIQR